MTKHLDILRNIIRGENHPFDAYRLSRPAGISVQDAGRALLQLAHLGEITGLKESGGNPLSERYVPVGRPLGEMR